MSRNAQNPGNQAYSTKFGIWLNGGVLKAENIMMTATSATTPQVVFNGGTYAPYGAKAANRTMECPNKVYVSAGGAVISTENIPAGEVYTIAQALLTDPALDGAVDGGLTKKGAGTLALTGANTFTGPLVVEEGVVALSGDATTLSQVSASGVVEGNLTVTNALVATAGSILSVDGKLSFARRSIVDFSGLGAGVNSTDWIPIAAANAFDIPAVLRASNAGEFTHCATSVVDGVLYVRLMTIGFIMIAR
jgi:autotransporter-associated beta strand protein